MHVHVDKKTILACLFFLQSSIAAWTASSASIEQCNFTGGKFKWFAMSEFLIVNASSTLPLDPFRGNRTFFVSPTPINYAHTHRDNATRQIDLDVPNEYA